VITLIRCVASPTRWQASAPLLASLALAATISGCGSAGHSGASAARRRTCQNVSATLSDGPDSQADPVGYAQAQILPLLQIRTDDHALGHAIAELSAAYRSFYDSNGSSPAAKRALSAAAKRVDSFCPGAAS
jgi:hypothetical protein